MVRKFLLSGFANGRRRLSTPGLLFVAGLILTVSCQNSSKNNNDPPSLSGANIAVVTRASDNSAANFVIVQTSDYEIIPNLHQGLHSDPAVRAFGGDIYILERMGRDNVTKYNARNVTRAVYNRNLGSGLNIQDIVVVSETKAYISANGSSDLIVFNPSTGNKTATIDLSSFTAANVADPPNPPNPFASALAAYGDYVYVACQRADATGYMERDTGLIVIINKNTNEIAGDIKLNKTNPQAMSVHGNKMLVVSAGNWYPPESSGIEVIDLTTNTNLGVIADGSDFEGGILTDVIFISADKAYVSVSVGWPTTKIFPVNTSTGAAGTSINGIESASGMAFDGVKLYAGDRAAEGVIVVNPATDAVEGQPIPTGLPPERLAVFYAN